MSKHLSRMQLGIAVTLVSMAYLFTAAVFGYTRALDDDLARHGISVEQLL